MRLTISEIGSPISCRIKIVLMDQFFCFRSSVLVLRQILSMRTLIVFLSLVAFISCNNSKEEKVKEPQSKIESMHPSSFNSSVQSAMNSYEALTEAFVNWDSSAVDKYSQELKVKLDSINFYGFNAETITAYVDTLNLARKDLQAMTSNKDITSKRHDLNDLTGHLYSFLKQVKYDANKVNLQQCPMAFNDTVAAVWLSETDSIRNPYLGLHHPKYGKAMIECGSTISTIDFTSKK